MHRLEDLKIWKKGIQLAKDVYSITSEMSSDEKYGLISQMKRSAVSIPSNIAEGVGRNSQKEFLHFLSIANGSAYELQTQLLLTVELKLISEEKIKPVLDKVYEIQKMGFGFSKVNKRTSILTSQY